VFRSGVDLKGTGDTSSVPQVFEYDAASGALARVSIGQRSPAGYECANTGIVEQGYDCNGNTTVGEDVPRIEEHAVNSVSQDGAVVFTSELPLTPSAVHGRTVRKENNEVVAFVENVYEYKGGQVYLVSPADEATPAAYESPKTQSRLFGIDESGKDVFFATPDSLVPQDTDTESSWYDAREGGGFPAPVGPVPCQGESCQGGAPPPPSFAAAGSNTLTGSGNLAPPAQVKPVPKPAVKPKPKTKTCKKGAYLKKRKCVPRPKSKKAKKAGTRRGAKS
jgi:hypothetical protein